MWSSLEEVLRAEARVDVPVEVTENKPMLDLVWRSVFRWMVWPRQLTGDSAYGTIEYISVVEKVGIRAYMPSKTPVRATSVLKG